MTQGEARYLGADQAWIPRLTPDSRVRTAAVVCRIALSAALPGLEHGKSLAYGPKVAGAW